MASSAEAGCFRPVPFLISSVWQSATLSYPESICLKNIDFVLKQKFLTAQGLKYSYY